MEKKIDLYKLATLSVLILLAALSRLLPHPPNFSPVIAISILGGAIITNRKLAFIIPIAVMVISDIFIGFHPYIWAVYSAMIVSVLIGMYAGKNMKFSKLVISSLMGSILFYIITNFAYWLTSGSYPMNLTGLSQAYIVGLPFFKYNPIEMLGFGMIGDLIYVTILYGAYRLAERKVEVLA